MARWAVLVVVIAIVIPGAAQASPDQGRPPERVRSVELSADQTCPPSTGNEVVVCYQAEEPYRLPKRFRRAEIAAANQSWANRAATLDEVGRVAGGLPNTCSPVGTGGQTGCTATMMRAWAAERRALAREALSVP